MPSDNSNQNIIHKATARIAKRFSDNVNTLNLSLETLAPEISKAAEKIVGTLLNEKKVLICGNGSSSILSQYMASLLVNSFETDRPALPAIALTSDTSLIALLNNNSHFDEMYTRQIQALGQENDILIAFVSNELTSCIVHAIQSAHEQKMQIILICADTSEDVTHYLGNNDKIIQILLKKQPQILELQLLTLHCICDLIDNLLFGTP